jgi:hypothetical protein
MMYQNRFIYVANQIMESKGRVWQLISLRNWDRLAELAVFTGCSSGVVCFTSYRQSAQSGIIENRNSKNVNEIIIFILNTHYRQENRDLLGCYAASSVTFLRTFRDKQSLSSWRVFCPLMAVHYRRFRTNYRLQFQRSLWRLIGC